MRTKAFPIPIVRFAPFRAIFKDVLSGNSYVSFIQGKLRKSISNYQEGYASLELGAGFFRPDSILARDLSVLIASMQYQEHKEKKVLRWLDLMAGCGIRALRWGLEAIGTSTEKKSSLRDLEIWANDADFDRSHLIKRNLQPLLGKDVALTIKNDFAEVLLARSHIDKCFFDLIDLDCFGSPNSLLQPVISALDLNGILILSSTDARSITGHDRLGAIRSLASAARTHPASWEIALRHQLSAIARQAWLLGRGIEPLVCFSDGRTFRLYVRIKKGLSNQEEQQLGLISSCEVCGAQSSQPLLKLKAWESCRCGIGCGHLIINGPLWIGPLQSVTVLAKIKKLYKELSVPIVRRSVRLIDRLHLDPGLPVFSWSVNDLASRSSLEAPPSLDLMIKLLRSQGYKAFRSGIVFGHFRTDAPIGELLRICEEKFRKGFKLDGDLPQ